MRLRWAKSISTFFLNRIETTYCLVFGPVASGHIANLQTHDLACAQPAAIGQRQHHPCLKAGGHGQDALDLLLAENKRYIYRLFKVKNLSREVMTPKGHAEQKIDPGHGLVARADAARHVKLLLHVCDFECSKFAPMPNLHFENATGLQLG
jgi:hypothetical protein